MNTDMSTPFFSVVLPIYNVEKYLERCIKSILNQEFTDFEILLVDDGCKDNCPQICDRWAKQDLRIRVIHKQNAGLGMARNTGLEAAKGKYIFFIDSDDYILPGLFSSVYKIIIKEQCESVFYGFSRVDAKGRILDTLVPSPEKMKYIGKEEIKNTLLPDFIARDPYTGRISNLRISAWNCCIKIQMLKENNLKFVSEREYISEDIYFYLEMFSKLKSAVFLPTAFYCYCQNVGSLTFSYKADRFKRLKSFYIEVDSLASELGYNDVVKQRLKESFIANVMGCLKMEAAHYIKMGLKPTYNRIKEICLDDYLKGVMKEYPIMHYGLTWKIFFYCVLHNRTVSLTIILLLQYKMKGI